MMKLRRSSIFLALLGLVSIAGLGIAGFTLPELVKLRSEFEKSLTNESRAMSHRHSMELKELDQSHEAQYKDWKRKENGERRVFFTENLKGPERRSYMQGIKERREALLKKFKEDRKEKKSRQVEEKKSLVERQKERRREFESYLTKGERPPEDLWGAASN
jgi:hypothetical protein